MDVLQLAVDNMFGFLGNAFRVVSGAVLLSALYVARATASGGRYARFGWSSEVDLAFWALARGTDGKLVWVPFYMFVDSGIALVAGREIYGYPKQLARFERDMGTLDHDPSVAVRTSFFPPSPDPTAAVDEILIRIRDTGPKALVAEEPRRFQPIDESNLPAILAHGMNMPVGLMEELTPPYGTPNGISVPMLLLKQFRDAASPATACYRAAICVETQSMGDVQVGIITNPVTLEIASSESHPIAQDLALNPGPIDPPGFVIHQDFRVHNARSLP
jgi:hypothetical protein